MNISMYYTWGAIIAVCLIYYVIAMGRSRKKSGYIMEEIKGHEPEIKNEYLNGILKPVADKVKGNIIGVVECMKKRTAYLPYVIQSWMSITYYNRYVNLFYTPHEYRYFLAVTKTELLYLEFNGDMQVFQLSEMQDIALVKSGLFGSVEKLTFSNYGKKHKFYSFKCIYHFPQADNQDILSPEHTGKIVVALCEPFAEKISGLKASIF
jgi:hypothetical protein